MSPCNLKAPFIVLANNIFLGSQHVFNINGTEVILAGNEFSGTEQEYYIRGMNVFSYKNLYKDQLQAHQVVGIHIHIDDDIYDGNRQIHDVFGLKIRMTNNEIRAKQHAHFERKLSHKNFLSDSRIDDELKSVISHYPRQNILLTLDNKWGLPHTNNLPNGNYERFIQKVMPRISFDHRPRLE